MRSICQSQIVAVADDHCRCDEKKQCQCQQGSSAHTRTLPLLEPDSPKAAENDDARHMQCPTRKAIAAHLALSHGVEEKLEVPGRAGQSAEKIVPQHGRAQYGLCRL